MFQLHLTLPINLVNVPHTKYPYQPKLQYLNKNHHNQTTTLPPPPITTYRSPNIIPKSSNLNKNHHSQIEFTTIKPPDCHHIRPHLLTATNISSKSPYINTTPPITSQFHVLQIRDIFFFTSVS